jgi:hypothetical protein
MTLGFNEQTGFAKLGHCQLDQFPRNAEVSSNGIGAACAIAFTPDLSSSRIQRVVMQRCGVENDEAITDRFDDEIRDGSRGRRWTACTQLLASFVVVLIRFPHATPSLHTPGHPVLPALVES